MAKQNAKQEFLGVIGTKPILAANFSFGDQDDALVFNLPPGYTSEQWDQALAFLDQDYDAGYGTQHLFGLIWGRNGDWWERYEYDGSENWTYMIYPALSDYFSPHTLICYERKQKLTRIIK